MESKRVLQGPLSRQRDTNFCKQLRSVQGNASVNCSSTHLPLSLPPSISWAFAHIWISGVGCIGLPSGVRTPGISHLSCFRPQRIPATFVTRNLLWNEHCGKNVSVDLVFHRITFGWVQIRRIFDFFFNYTERHLYSLFSRSLGICQFLSQNANVSGLSRGEGHGYRWLTDA